MDVFCWEDMQCTLGPAAWLSLVLSLGGRADLAKLPVSHQRSVLSSKACLLQSEQCFHSLPDMGLPLLRLMLGMVFLQPLPPDDPVEPGDKALV